MKISFLLLLALVTSCASQKKIHYSGTDFHMHIHSSNGDDDMQFTGERALLAADSINLKRAVLLPNSFSKNVTLDYAIKENNYAANEAKKDRKHLAAACAVNPMKAWALTEVERCADIGLKILKVHFMASGMNLTQEKDFKIASQLIRKAGNLGMTVLIHANYPASSRPGEIQKVRDLINEFPNVRWIVGHLAGREFEILKTIKHQNFFVEISVTPLWMKTLDHKEKLVSTMFDVGIKKFVFGSDWPVFHPAEMLKALKKMPLNRPELNQILYTNATQLDDLFE